MIRRALIQPFLSVFLGLALGLLATLIAGENPIHVFWVLVRSAFGSGYDFGMTLVYTVPLALTGLSVAVAFRGGLFNVGAEGQLTLAALAVAAVGVLFPGVPSWIAPWLAAGAGVSVGAIWGAIPGYLRARRGSHEVITTIMLNFVAAGIASWLTLTYLQNPDSQNPETASVGASYVISKIAGFGEAPVNSSVILVVILAFGIWLFFKKTSLGFEIRAVGENERAAWTAGMDPARIRIQVMALAGAVAGLVAVGEVLGVSGKYRLGFSPGFGFTGIAVALLARNHPIGVLASALLFGALHKGTGDLDLETENVTRDLAQILQACVILSVSAERLWVWLIKNKKRTTP